MLKNSEAQSHQYSYYTPYKYIDEILEQEEELLLPSHTFPAIFSIYSYELPLSYTENFNRQHFGGYMLDITIKIGSSEIDLNIDPRSGDILFHPDSYDSNVHSSRYVIEAKSIPTPPPFPGTSSVYELIRSLNADEIIHLVKSKYYSIDALYYEETEGAAVGFRKCATCFSVDLDGTTNNLGLNGDKGHLFALLAALQYEKSACLLEHIQALLCWREFSGFMHDTAVARLADKILSHDKGRISNFYRHGKRSDLSGKADYTNYYSKMVKFLRDHPDSTVRDTERHFEAYSYCIKKRLEMEDRPEGVLNPLSGEDFEHRMLNELVELGYTVSKTPNTGDFGADLIAEKEGLTYIIQCKAHRKPVGVKAVQEAEAARRYYKGDYAVVISLSGYTSAAREMAFEVGVGLSSPDSLPAIETYF